MKIPAAFLFATVMLLLVSCSKTPPPAAAHFRPATTQWYQLAQGDEYVTEFTLEAGGNHPIEIISDDALLIGFRTDASTAVVKRYFQTFPQPVRLEVVGVRSSIGSVIGMSGDFPPVDGKLRFMAVNETDTPLKLVVYKRKSTRTVIWPGVKKANSHT